MGPKKHTAPARPGQNRPATTLRKCPRADVVIDLANSRSFEPAAAMDFFGTRSHRHAKPALIYVTLIEASETMPAKFSRSLSLTIRISSPTKSEAPFGFVEACGPPDYHFQSSGSVLDRSTPIIKTQRIKGCGRTRDAPARPPKLTGAPPSMNDAWGSASMSQA